MRQSTLADSFLADFDEEEDDALTATTATTATQQSLLSQQPSAAQVGSPSSDSSTPSSSRQRVRAAVPPSSASVTAAASPATVHNGNGYTHQSAVRAGSAAEAQADKDEDDADDEESSRDGAAAADGEAAEDGDETDHSQTLASSSLRSSSSLSPLLTSGTLPGHLSALSALLASSSMSSDREYPFLSASIRLLSSIDSEITLVHRYLLSVYSLRYGELEQLVGSPVHYARVVRLLANFSHGSDVSAVETELQAFLPNNVVLTISVTAATSSGRLLTADELGRAMEAASTILSLHDGRERIVSYMESRMSLIAPNLSALVGSTVAAHLLSVAGGLRKLSEIPACNVQVLGSRQQRHSALSSVTQELHVGAIGHSAVMLGCPAPLRRKAARLLAGKVSLAARVDEQRDDSSGDKGRELRALVEAKIELWQQPPPAALTKALPAPLAQSNKKRRGGKRFRKEKQRYAVSETRKQKNRMAFGKEELIDEYTGEEFGMMGQHEGSGQLRSRDKDTQQLSRRLSRDMQRRVGYGAAKGGGGGGGGLEAAVGGAVTVIGGGGGGTASSIAFTPVQGMELVNNEQKRMKLADSSHNYFAATASFTKAQTNAPHSSKLLPLVPKFS